MKPRALITREAERAAELVRLLEEAGMDAHVEPVTRTVFLPHDDEELPALESFDWLVFTSANGVKGFNNCFTFNALPATLKTAVVGPGTAQMVAKLFREPDFVAKQNDAVSLAAELLEEDTEMAQHAVLWPCAAHAGFELALRLKDAGANVVPWPVYVTEPVPQEELLERLIRLWPWAVAVFAAPSAVAAFASAWPTPWDFPCVAIGQVTAKALHKAGAKNVRVSPTPQAADLRDAILESINLR
ncbi:MAG TPA: uroporphyrinogen-III synthase [bacterium]|jgi:uroporphyrinogen-III synthase